MESTPKSPLGSGLEISHKRCNIITWRDPLNGIYSQQFNRRHNRVGHVLQGRYKAIVVDKDKYLLELCRYVVLNPVRAGIVRWPEQWRWSSYKGTAGYAKGISCLMRDWILLQFGDGRGDAEKRCRGFVHEGLKLESPSNISF